MSSNQARFDERLFPFVNKEMIEKYQSDQATDTLYRTDSDVNWIPYNPLHISNYTRVHFDPASDMKVIRVNAEEECKNGNQFIHTSHSTQMASRQDCII